MKLENFSACLAVCAFLSACNDDAQAPQRIPLDQLYVAVSLNGENFIRYFPTLILPREPIFGVYTAGGKMACNYWIGYVTQDEKTLSLNKNGGITAMGCDEYRHHIDRVFIDTIKAVKQWRMEKQWRTGQSLLVLEGESILFVMRPCQTRGLRKSIVLGSGWPDDCHDREMETAGQVH